MDVINTQKEARAEACERIRLEANTEAERSTDDNEDDKVLQQSQLPWAAWFFEQARLTSSLSTSIRRKMSVQLSLA